MCAGWEARLNPASKRELPAWKLQPERLPESFPVIQAWGTLVSMLTYGFASPGPVRIQDAGTEPHRSVWMISVPEAQAPWVKGCSQGSGIKIIHFNTLEPSTTLQKVFSWRIIILRIIREYTFGSTEVFKLHYYSNILTLKNWILTLCLGLMPKGSREVINKAFLG